MLRPAPTPSAESLSADSPLCCAGLSKTESVVSTRIRVFNATFIPLVVSNTVVQTLSGRSSSWLYRSWPHWFFLLFLAVLTIAPWTLIWLYTSDLARQAHPFLTSAD